MSIVRQSHVFTKSQKSSKEYDSINATLLQKGGFIDQVMAGVYSFLPLGLRVLTKIENVIRSEMDKIGQEVLLPALSPKENWIKTGRLDSVDVLFKASGANEASTTKNDTEYVLNATHEDVLTPHAQKFNTSYKDLPKAVYQIQSKFRNEARPKSGLLRGREFRMKDLYSFHVSEEDQLDFYHNAALPAYVTVFEKLGLGEDTVVALASGGDFTKENSHEFQTKCETGEDTIFYDATSDTHYNKEIAPSKAPVLTPDAQQKEREDIDAPDIIGVEEIAKHLGIEVERTTKTLFYETDKKGLEFIAVAVRGGYDINELKLKNIVGCPTMHLASKEMIMERTGAEVGYAGVVDLPEGIPVFYDDSLEGRTNFETGANKTGFHSININFGRDLPEPEKFYDFKVAREGDTHPESGQVYESFKASEVGNIFPLGTKFPDSFDYTYTDENGKEKPVYMGSYGIGSSRLMGVIVEKFHDDKGILWPKQVAPFHVHIINLKKDATRQAEDVAAQCGKAGFEVLLDDRKAGAGEKFADSDLFGIPVRLVISDRLGEQVEWKERASDDAVTIDVDQSLQRLQEFYSD